MAKIIVVGAGLSGLALAQCIRAHRISHADSSLTCHVYERDEHLASRASGWTLSLMECLPGMAQRFAADMPSLERSVSVTRPACLDGQGRFFDDAGEPGMTAGGVGPGQPGYFLRAERVALRNWLCHRLDGVHWDKTFERYEQDADGITVWFRDGTSDRGHVLVAADGPSSRVRTQLLGPEASRPTLPPVALIIGEVRLNREQTLRQLELSTAFWIYNATPPRPKIFTGVHALRLATGRQAASGASSLQVIRNDVEGGDYFWFFMWPDTDLPEQGSKHWLTTASKEEQLEHVRKLAADVPDHMREVLDLSKAENISTPTVQFKEFTPPEQLPEGRVTLLGDAAHAMTPFKGQGANTALLGVFDLFDALLQLEQGRHASIEAALKSYEADMLPRGRRNLVAAQSAFGKDARQYERDMAARYGRDVPGSGAGAGTGAGSGAGSNLGAGAGAGT